MLLYLIHTLFHLLRLEIKRRLRVTYTIKDIDFEMFKKENLERTDEINKLKEFYVNNKEMVDKCINSVFIDKQLDAIQCDEIKFQIIDDNRNYYYFLELKVVAVIDTTLSLALRNFR